MLIDKRGIGVMVAESVLSNYNGNPDEEDAPRTLPDGHGLITPVCFKHRVRELLEDHEGVTWDYFKEELDLSDDAFYIWESSLKGFDADNPLEARKQWIKIVKDEGEDALVERFWDMRVFGTTALEDKKKVKDNPLQFKRTGVITVTPFISILPVDVISQTITKGNPLRPKLMEKNQGDIAPFGFKVARHAVFVASYVVNPHRARHTNTSEHDVEVFKTLASHAFSVSTAASRSGVRVIQHIHATHEHPITSFNEAEFLQVCRPKTELTVPSMTLNDYKFVTEEEIKDAFPDVEFDMIVDLTLPMSVKV